MSLIHTYTKALHFLHVYLRIEPKTMSSVEPAKPALDLPLFAILLTVLELIIRIRAGAPIENPSTNADERVWWLYT